MLNEIYWVQYMLSSIDSICAIMLINTKTNFDLIMLFCFFFFKAGLQWDTYNGSAWESASAKIENIPFQEYV